MEWKAFFRLSHLPLLFSIVHLIVAKKRNAKVLILLASGSSFLLTSLLGGDHGCMAHARLPALDDAW